MSHLPHPRSLLGLVLLCGLAACSGESRLANGCANNADCGPSGVCEAGLCAIQCQDSLDCEPGAICIQERCRLVPNAACTSHGECNSPNVCQELVGARCFEGECTYPTKRCVNPDAPYCFADNQTYVIPQPGACAPSTGECVFTEESVPCEQCDSVCDGAATCDENQQCDGALTCIKGLCRPSSDFDAPCDDDEDCVENHACNALGVCKRDHQSGCDNGAEQCVEACIGGSCASFSPDGEPCDVGEAGDCAPLLSCDDGSCTDALQCGDDNTLCGTETCINDFCRPRPALGEECDDENDCIANATCNGVCLGGLDATCSDNAQCQGKCVNGLCKPDPGTGDACDEPDDCPSPTTHQCHGAVGAMECLLRDGQECVGAQDDDCISGHCIVDECGSTQPANGLCDSSTDCNTGESLTCVLDDQRCRVVSGGICPIADNGRCEDGACIGGVCDEPRGVTEVCDRGDDVDCLGDARCGHEGVNGTYYCATDVGTDRRFIRVQNDRTGASQVTTVCRDPFGNGNYGTPANSIDIVACRLGAVLRIQCPAGSILDCTNTFCQGAQVNVRHCTGTMCEILVDDSLSATSAADWFRCY